MALLGQNHNAQNPLHTFPRNFPVDAWKLPTTLTVFVQFWGLHAALLPPPIKFHSRRICQEKPAPKAGARKWSRFSGASVMCLILQCLSLVDRADVRSACALLYNPSTRSCYTDWPQWVSSYVGSSSCSNGKKVVRGNTSTGKRHRCYTVSHLSQASEC